MTDWLADSTLADGLNSERKRLTNRSLTDSILNKAEAFDAGSVASLDPVGNLLKSSKASERSSRQLPDPVTEEPDRLLPPGRTPAARQQASTVQHSALYYLCSGFCKCF